MIGTNSQLHRAWPSRFLGGLTLFALWASASAAITVDGNLDDVEWSSADAYSCSSWKRTDPFTLDDPQYPTQASVVSTPEGLAVAFIVQQPSQVERVRQRSPKNSESLLGDSVGFMVDFDGSGQTGYEFSVSLGGSTRDGLIINQNKFSFDWDGTWQHAVLETPTAWQVEVLIPWNTINMRNATEPHHTIGVYFNRWIYDKRERDSCPALSYDNAALLSDFQRIDIERPAPQSDFTAAPYATAMQDLVADSTHVKAGVDVTWRPTGNMQLAASIDPDFGQVESDELIVNFSSIETLYTDKRPFFTQNQALFDLRTPQNGQLIYTRRIGGPTDDGLDGSSDIDAALKLTGSLNNASYGVFAAQEDDYSHDQGRLFSAARMMVPTSIGRFGYLSTWTDRPYLDRQAAVNAFDFDFANNAAFRTSGQVIRSDIDTAGESASGYLGWLQQDINRSEPLNFSLKALLIDREFDMNDMGYLERNSLRFFEGVIDNKRPSKVSGVDAIHDNLSIQYKQNMDGEQLLSRTALTRTISYANGWSWMLYLRHWTAGVDDLLSQGNGVVQLSHRNGVYSNFSTPRFGHFQYLFGAGVFQEGVSDYSAYLDAIAMFHAGSELTLSLELVPQRENDWLFWNGDNRFATANWNRLDYILDFNWFPSPRQELRVKWQWIGIDATGRQSYVTDSRGNLMRTNEPVDGFTVNNLGLQVRYRYSIGSSADVYAVYSRGGYQEGPEERSLGGLFGDMASVRDVEQFLLKFVYRTN
ncbi:MAG: DUF5916 domain-containing protein [Povalibacter sp.]